MNNDLPSEIHQNMPYFWNMRTHVTSFFIFPNKCPFLIWQILKNFEMSFEQA